MGAGALSRGINSQSGSMRPGQINPGATGDAIRFEDVSLAFEEKSVLSEITFAVPPGETLVLLGETGAGKTVLLKLALGLIQPDSGRIFILGREITGLPEEELFEIRKKIGMVFQEGALFDSLSVAENVAYRLQEEGVPAEETVARVSQALRFVEMEDAMAKLPAELSGGMRRRVAIARALINEPPILFYDSPTAGLDPVTAETILSLVLRLRDLEGATSVLVSQRLQDGFAVANYYFDQKTNRVRPARSPTDGSFFDTRTLFMMLREGKIYFQGAPEEMARTGDPYLEEFLR
jgi:phospholipid/cholesterol/gamma-HCH transport system ATP-binding protein